MRLRGGGGGRSRREGDLRPARAGAPGDGLRRALPVLADRGRVHAVGRARRRCGAARARGVVALHEIPLERRTLHGHFSRDLEPILTVDPGDSIAFACLNAGWRDAAGDRVDFRLEATSATPATRSSARSRSEARTPARRWRSGSTRCRVGAWGVTDAGGSSTPLNERLGLVDGETVVLDWELDADAGVGSRPARSRGRLAAVPRRDRHAARRAAASTRRRRLVRAAGTSTARSSSRARRCSCRSRSTARSSRPATATPRRATARCRSSRSRRRSSGRG